MGRNLIESGFLVIMIRGGSINILLSRLVVGRKLEANPQQGPPYRRLIIFSTSNK